MPLANAQLCDHNLSPFTSLIRPYNIFYGPTIPLRRSVCTPSVLLAFVRVEAQLASELP